MGSPADPYTVRQADMDRIDRTVHEIAIAVGVHGSKLSDIRVLLAEGYVSKGDHERALAASKTDLTEAVSEIRSEFHDHTESDDDRFRELRRLLYGLIGAVLLLLGTTVFQLILTLVQTKGPK